MNPFYRLDNILSEFDKLNSNPQFYSYSSSSSINSIANSDGSTTIIESQIQNNNGQNNKTFNVYKKMPNGTVVPLSKEEVNKLFSEQKYIKNN